MSGRVKITGIDLSGYMTTDAPRAIAWYRDVLGDVVPFQPGNGLLFAVDDLDAAVAALAERNVPILNRREPPTCRMAMIVDPDGNSIWLHQRNAA